MVPRYVDDLARPGQGPEPARTGRAPGSGEALGEDGAPAEAAAGTAGPDAGSIWSAWSGPRTTRTEGQPAAAGRDVREQGGEGGSPEDSRTERDAIDGGAAPGGGAGDEETGAGDRGTDATGDEHGAVTADRAAVPGSPMARDAAAPETGPPEAGPPEAERRRLGHRRLRHAGG